MKGTYLVRPTPLIRDSETTKFREVVRNCNEYFKVPCTTFYRQQLEVPPRVSQSSDGSECPSAGFVPQNTKSFDGLMVCYGESCFRSTLEVDKILEIGRRKRGLLSEWLGNHQSIEVRTPHNSTVNMSVRRGVISTVVRMMFIWYNPPPLDEEASEL